MHGFTPKSAAPVMAKVQIKLPTPQSLFTVMVLCNLGGTVHATVNGGVSGAPPSCRGAAEDLIPKKMYVLGLRIQA